MELHSHASCFDPEEQSSKKTPSVQVEWSRVQPWIKSSCFSDAFCREHSVTEHQTPGCFTVLSLLQTQVPLTWKYLKLTCNLSSGGRFRNRTPKPCIPTPLLCTLHTVLLLYLCLTFQTHMELIIDSCSMFCLWQQEDDFFFRGGLFNSWCVTTPREENSTLMWSSRAQLIKSPHPH